MREDVQLLRKQIFEAIPLDRVIPKHTEKGHFYQIMEGENPTYPSVTGKLQIVKDESLINWKMKQAIQYVFSNWEKFDNDNIYTHLENASKVAQDIMFNAADIGTEVHNYRENYFNDWITTGERPPDVLSYIPQDRYDVRAVSAMRALDKFCNETGYVPVVSELFVYSHKMKVAGTLDDIGLMDGKLVLLDVKTSNHFKDHYFFQVATYYAMFRELTGMRPQRSFILKLSKTDGQYHIEDLKVPSVLVRHAKNMIRVNDGIAYIKSLRKDNQKKVKQIQL